MLASIPSPGRLVVGVLVTTCAATLFWISDKVDFSSFKGSPFLHRIETSSNQSALISTEVPAGLPIVSLATTESRYRRGQQELAVTLHSLLRQKGRIGQIRLHLPLSEERTLQRTLRDRGDGLRLAAMMSDPLIHTIFVDDIGPCAKFFYTIRDLLAVGDVERPVIVVDDDHRYSRSLVHTLMRFAQKPQFADSAIGFRGWRVHSDLRWRVKVVKGTKHSLKAWELSKPLQVSVLSANEGYLIRPRFFGNTTVDAESTLLDLHTMMGSSAHFVDDIWMNGNLARNGVGRFVVPLKDRTRNQEIASKSRLQQTLKGAAVSRAQANDETLEMFREEWKKEGLWQDTGEPWWREYQAHG